MEYCESAIVLLHEALMIFTNISGSIKNIITHIELGNDIVDVTELIVQALENIDKSKHSFKASVHKLSLDCKRSTTS